MEMFGFPLLDLCRYNLKSANLVLTLNVNQVRNENLVLCATRKARLPVVVVTDPWQCVIGRIRSGGCINIGGISRLLRHIA